MAEVTECLYNRECCGKVVIDDTLKAAIDAYYETYGAKEERLKRIGLFANRGVAKRRPFLILRSAKYRALWQSTNA